MNHHPMHPVPGQEREVPADYAREQNAKLAAQNHCEARRMKMPEQDFATRPDPDHFTDALAYSQQFKSGGIGMAERTVPEIEAQVSSLALKAQLLHDMINTTHGRLEPVLKQAGGIVSSNGDMPSRSAYLAHELQKIEIVLDAAIDRVSDTASRLAL